MAPHDEPRSVILAVRRRLRGALSAALAPLVNWLAARGVEPDHVTWAGFFLVCAAAALAGFHLFLLAGLLYVAGGAADLLDGALARRTRRHSRAGAFLDSVLDRAGEGLLHVAVAVAFAYRGYWPGVLAVMLSLTGSYLTSYARARVEGLGAALEEAWAGRGERVAIIAAGLIFHFAVAAFWVVAAAGWLTAAQRVWIGRRRLAGAGPAAHSESEPVPEERD